MVKTKEWFSQQGHKGPKDVKLKICLCGLGGLAVKFPFVSVIAQFILLAVTLAVVSSCATTALNKIGTEHYAPLGEGVPVTIFPTQSDVKEAYAVVGFISYDGPGNNLKFDLGPATEQLKEKARAVGGNAIIIDKLNPIKLAVVSTGIHVEARAIHLVP